MNLRISLVNYLNAAPLGWYFLHGPDRRQFQISLATPASCARQLADGDVDIGLIPTIEYQRIPDLRIIPGAAIAASSEVRSVLLVRRRGSESLRSVALDTSSRTSVALVQLLLCSRLGLSPEFVPHEPDISAMLDRCDAALLIGDAALKCSPNDYELTDLAAEWRNWQARPFVFAFWACRPTAQMPENLAEVFIEAKKWGLARIDEIAAHFSRLLDLPVGFLASYLRNNLDHNLEAEHMEGLDRFYRLSFEAGLIERLIPVRFFHP